MKIVFVLRNVANFRHFDEVVRHFNQQGHLVKIVFEQDSKENTSDRAIQECIAETDTVEFEFVGKKAVRWWQLRRRVRNLIRDWICYAFYFKPEHPSRSLNWRFKKYLPRPMQWATRISPLNKLLVSERVLRFLQKIQPHLPLDAGIVQSLKAYSPDVVLSSPFIKRSTLDVEYIRAALALRIPAIVAVLSWDNLTSRGTFHAVPDAIFLWNQALKKEAVELHGLPAERIVVTGAPTFDFWFAMQPQMSREEFCKMVGLQAAQPYIVYLGSSWSIAQDERAFMREFADALASCPSTRAVQILMRPHPLNAEVWQDFVAENICVWPRAGQWPDNLDARQEYFETLYHSSAVMGVNTSAFLDAAVVDKPCVTAITSHYQQTQGGRGHFAHLVNGNFIEMVSTLEAAAATIGDVISGHDKRAVQRRKFVEDFVRPQGMDQSASKVFADAVTKVASR
jgi:hypothetical protein